MRNGLRSTTQWIVRFACVVSVIFSALSLASSPTNRVVAVDFRVDDDKNGKIIVELNSDKIVVDIQKLPEGLAIELIDTAVDDKQLSLFDVQDFATSVKTVELFRKSDRVRLLAEVSGRYSYDYTLNGKVLEVVVSALKTKEKEKETTFLDKPGKKISINFQDIPVRNVLQLIADYNDFNLVVSDSVSGNLTLRLDGVPWPQVLDIILQVKGLDKRVDGNVVLVAPKAELDLREKQRLENARVADELGELRSEIIKVNFANAGEIAEMIGGEGTISMLSERGSITVDERTNSILMRDLQENIDVVRSIIESLDIPVKQVQIEARIVTVSEGNLDELGVRWGFSNANKTGVSVGGTIEGNVLDNPSIDDMLNVNLAASAEASTIAFQVAKLGSDMLLDLELSALQRESKAEVISSPRLITTNKKSAYIEQGTEIPYLESSSSGATSVEFKKAVLSLMVTPQITPDNRLVLDLSVTQDRPGEVFKVGTGEAVSIETQRIGTQVLVENGETVVLGGIFQHNITDTVDKVPLLGDIPLLGTLFKRSYQKMGKSELLIFVTPKVVVQ
ncbi:type IV pilus secretin PilQ [Vibrio renipiscarius]|uniref:Fimbrial protein n=1 Tax=Vibrio renipiscarius TaxID=1461322 RepID=A0A0C2K6Q8_9VIBR|nr:type IV pilus secretin PilQ family protein [Vibrio renipiscarius]KII77713.1 fimbrial protein [Vibrio renipiscarius]KII81537.1 fimbrial protein [Vibrio renipiscarius]